MSLRVGIIGAGWMGNVHTRAVEAAGDRVVAVIEPRPDVGRRLAVPRDASHHRHLADLLESGTKVDAAVVATPSADHLRQVGELVDAGVPVLTEKPPWVLDQGKLVAPLILKAGWGAVDDVPVAVGMTTRFEPGIKAITDAVRGGELGEVEYVHDNISFQFEPGALPSWYDRPPSAGGGIVLTNGVHAADRVGRLHGDRGPTLNRADFVTNHPTLDNPNFAHLSLNFGPGRTADVELLWSRQQPAPSHLRVMGSGGNAWLNGADGTWQIHARGGTRSGERPPGYGPDSNHTSQWRSYRTWLLREARPPILPTLADVRRVMPVIEQAARGEEKARRGEPAGSQDRQHRQHGRDGRPLGSDGGRPVHLGRRGAAGRGPDSRKPWE